MKLATHRIQNPAYRAGAAAVAVAPGGVAAGGGAATDGGAAGIGACAIIGSGTAGLETATRAPQLGQNPADSST
ncbi:MAG TPA: hypothetical protein VJW75_08660 [Candidatus Eisenbacteria bacterium]|nr:hypothetical protein [Candidatus Eisenbacteria bacterium]